MIERERNGKELRETFKVLGSTGNVYTVRIDTSPSCDCKSTIDGPVRLLFRSSGPDALRGNHCKHIVSGLLISFEITEATYTVIRIYEGMRTEYARLLN
jgi:hypothetical protein